MSSFRFVIRILFRNESGRRVLRTYRRTVFSPQSAESNRERHPASGKPAQSIDTFLFLVEQRNPLSGKPNRGREGILFLEASGYSSSFGRIKRRDHDPDAGVNRRCFALRSACGKKQSRVPQHCFTRRPVRKE